MDFKEIEYGNMEYINLAQDRAQCRALVNPVIDVRDPKKAGNTYLFLTYILFKCPLNSPDSIA